MRIVAVDWSGRLHGERSAIVAATVEDGGLVDVRAGRSRAQVIDALVKQASTDDRLVVGLDFAFSFPAWFLAERGYRSAIELWDAAAREGEQWLLACDPPFYGRAGRLFPTLRSERLFRRTELAIPAVAGIRPKPVFKIGLQGNVGTGAIRGMPYLAQLHRAGFAIWPFDPPRWPCVLEIYPRALTGPADKSIAAAAVISALMMWDHRDELESLPVIADPLVRLEGWIWAPREGLRPAGARSSTPAQARPGPGARAGS